MPIVYFKTRTSEHVGLVCTHDGRINTSDLGRVFGLDLNSIMMNGILFPSDYTWKQIMANLKAEGKPLGKEVDPVIIGVPPLSTEEGSPSKRGRVEGEDSPSKRGRVEGEGSPSKRGRVEGEGSPSKRGRVETSHWQAFVQSAAKHYKEWSKKCEDSADVENDSTMKFLTVSGDPLINFLEDYILGIQECYRDLKKILEKSEAGKCFVVLGTSGIGKSCFYIFWVCHLAANKKKVVWKLHNKFNLLDFSDEAAKFDGQLEESDPKIQEVF